jgi:hypothetical protein
LPFYRSRVSPDPVLGKTPIASSGFVTGSISHRDD